jgi:hypothetical protein
VCCRLDDACDERCNAMPFVEGESVYAAVDYKVLVYSYNVDGMVVKRMTRQASLVYYSTAILML